MYKYIKFDIYLVTKINLKSHLIMKKIQILFFAFMLNSLIYGQIPDTGVIESAIKVFSPETQNSGRKISANDMYDIVQKLDNKIVAQNNKITISIIGVLSVMSIVLSCILLYSKLKEIRNRLI